MEIFKHSITDADGNFYNSIKIGNQIWALENLRTTTYNDGSTIPNNETWINLSKPCYCWYENDKNNMNKYGALYNWYAINTGKLAPKGWHVPSNEEWINLEEYLISNGYNWDKSTNGNKIAKSLAAKTDWQIMTDGRLGTIGHNLSVNNRSGFSALPGGCRMVGGSFENIGIFGGWWSSTEDDASDIFARTLDIQRDFLRRFPCSLGGFGLSVRLICD